MLQPRGDGGAALGGRGVGELQCRLRAGEFGGDVDATAGQVPDLFERGVVPGVDGRGRTQRSGLTQLVVVDVSGDHLRRAAGDRPQHAGQADAAESDDEHGLAEPQARGMNEGPDAGEHGAAEHRGDVVVERRVHLDQRLARDDRVLGEAGDAQMVMHVPTVLAQPAAAGEQGTGIVGLGAGGAQGRPAVGAVRAVTAAGHERAHDVIADREVGHARAHLDDLPGGLVAEDHRHRARAVAVDGRQIRVTQARRVHLEQHLAGLRPTELEGLDGQRPGLVVGTGRGHFAQYGGSGLHAISWTTGQRRCTGHDPEHG